MRVLLLLCLLLPGLLLTGCRKKSSKEFYKLEADQSILVAREGDEAYLTPEMDAVLAGLQAIPDDALEKEKATNLAAKLTAEQARVKAEKAALAAPPRPPPSDPFAGRTTEPTPVEPAPPGPEDLGDAGEPVDAGEPTQPWSGMEEKDFVQRFGSCFSAAPKATLPDGREATAYVLSANPKCQKQFGLPDTTVRYLFTERGLWGKATETVQVRDAGVFQLPVPPQPPPPPAPPPIITTPGQPQPEGYDKVGP